MNNLEQALRLGLADRYVVDREIGRGGMAVVYHAVDIKHDRPVAIKAFRPPTADPVARSRFQQEIRTVATLSHPHILQLHDSGEVGGILYFVTPFIDGETLRDRMNRGALSPAEAVRIGAAVAGALDHAHRRGVVHRDVKPENILLQDDQPLLADFGIAFPFGAMHADMRLTDGGYRIGTPAYMSPEQVAGAEVDGRSDIYGLGLVMFEMVAGRKPFEGRPPEAVLAAQVSETPATLSTVRPGVPSSLARAIDRALEKDPERRWPDAGAFAGAMERIDAPTSRRVSRLPIGMAAGVVLLVVAFLLAQARFATPDGPPTAVMLADFDGPPDEPGLALLVRELVLLSISQSETVTPLSPDDVSAVRHAAGIGDTAPLPLTTARQLAERAGAAAVITGNVHARGEGYSVVLRAVQPVGGRDIFRSVAHADDVDGLVRAAAAAADDLRHGLGERTRSIDATQPLINIATPSFAAFRKYASALERSRVGDPVGSSALLYEAVALDSGFSGAWAQIALNYLDARQLDSADLAMRRALERPERLVDATRYRLEAEAAYTLDSDPAGAVERYDRYLEEVTRSSGGRNNRALYLTMLGRWDEARTEFLRAAAENPRGSDAAPMQRLNAISAAVSLGRLDSARREVSSLPGSFGTYGDLLVTAAEGRWSEAGALAASVLGDRTAPPWLLMQAVTTRAAGLVEQGSAEEADRFLAEAATTPGVVGRWYFQGRMLLAMARGTPLPIIALDTVPGAMIMHGIAAGWNGDPLTADRIARGIAAFDEPRRRRLGNGVVLLRAAALGGRGDWAAAAALLSMPAKAGELDAFALDRPSSDLLRWAEARAWLRAGDTASAARALAPLRTTTQLPPNQMPLRGLTLRYARPFLVSPS